MSGEAAEETYSPPAIIIPKGRRRAKKLTPAERAEKIRSSVKRSGKNRMNYLNEGSGLTKADLYVESHTAEEKTELRHRRPTTEQTQSTSSASDSKPASCLTDHWARTLKYDIYFVRVRIVCAALLAVVTQIHPEYFELTSDWRWDVVISFTMLQCIIRSSYSTFQRLRHRAIKSQINTDASRQMSESLGWMVNAASYLLSAWQLFFSVFMDFCIFLSVFGALKGVQYWTYRAGSFGSAKAEFKSVKTV
eukprot:6668_1